jgi:predicted ArsR family transcriptional regulator
VTSRTPERSGSATHKALAAESRLALLNILEQAAGPLDAVEAGRRVGLHRNTARVHLDQLVQVGLVNRQAEQRSSPGRPRVLYSKASGTGEGAEPIQDVDDVDYRELARVLAAQLARSADAAQQAELAGRRWAAAIDTADLPSGPVTSEVAVDAVTGVMDDLGFRPVADGRRILLRRCPFGDLAKEQRQVICGVHLGMLKQTFDSLDAPLTVDRLDSMVQDDPLLCVVHLAEQQKDAPSLPSRRRAKAERDGRWSRPDKESHKSSTDSAWTSAVTATKPWPRPAPPRE